MASSRDYMNGAVKVELDPIRPCSFLDNDGDYINYNHHPPTSTTLNASEYDRYYSVVEAENYGFMELLAAPAPNRMITTSVNGPNCKLNCSGDESKVVVPKNGPATPSTATSASSADDAHKLPTVDDDDDDEEDQHTTTKKQQQNLKSKKKDQNSSNKKKRYREARFAFVTKTEVDHLEDGYRWRKYGQKAVKNSPFPRSYYRCTSGSCNVKKRVERCFADPTTVVTTYEGQHTHPTSTPSPMNMMPRPQLSQPRASSFLAPRDATFIFPLLTALSHQPHFTTPHPTINRHTPAADHGLLQDIVPSVMRMVAEHD